MIIINLIIYENENSSSIDKYNSFEFSYFIITNNQENHRALSNLLQLLFNFSNFYL